MSDSQSLAMPQMQGYQALQKKIMANGESEVENSKQVLGTIFYLNRLFSHRATKT